MKKVLALALAAVMVMALCGVASATTTVTITNAGADKTYEFKKAFDVTYNADTSINRTYTTNATFAGVINGDTDAPLTAAAGNSGEWNIAIKSGKSEADIRDWLQTHYTDIPGSAVSASSGSADLGDGFYVMKVTDSSATDIKYSTILVRGEDALPVIDKNDSIPGPDKKETVDGTDYGAGHTGMNSDEHPTANVGDTITYTVTGSFPMYIFNAATNESELVKKLTLTDSITDGLAYVPDSITLTINGSEPVTGTTVVIPTLSGTETTFTVSFTTVNASGAFQYNSNNTYTLSYQAKITEAAIVDNEETNTVTLHYDQGSRTNIDGGTDTTTVWHYDISLKKVDGTSTTTVLKGAEFKLYTGDETTKTLLDLVLVTGIGYGDGTEDATANNVYRLAETGDSPVSAMVVGATGIIEVKGLENGNYYFEETKAPNGYNLVSGYTEAAVINNNNAAQLVVENYQGTVLPSTGGIGTTIFYVSGLLMVLGAATILISRRRAESK